MTAQATAHAPAPAPDLDWWRGGVIYQIYPRSFQDTAGDGVGDLRGISERLPYVASLGVDAIWVSPFFPSPMKDFGYDVSDYRDIDPMFGTLADFDELVATAHRLGLRVMIDLVLSHTSDAHPWFHESRADRGNPRADWYVWADAKPDGTPPNNWLSIFGGPAWRWDASRQQYFLHNFLESQPDLNFHNPEVQDALLDVTRFWLDRGVDGFRLDTINFYFHDAELRDNPALPPERRNAKIAPQVNPYNHQEHVYSKNRPENVAFLKRYRDLLDEYPGSAAVGEIGDAQLGMELMGDYTRAGQGVQMCYAFDFLAGDLLTARRVAEVFDRLDSHSPDGWACWAFSNHDVTRHVSRWQLDRAGRALLRDADPVPARLGLPLSGRGTRPDRGRRRLRGSPGPLRDRVLAGVQGPRRLPHADGLGGLERAGRLHRCRRAPLASRGGRASGPRGQRAGDAAGLAPASLPRRHRRPQRLARAPARSAIGDEGPWRRAVLHPRRGHGTGALRLQPRGERRDVAAPAGRLGGRGGDRRDGSRARNRAHAARTVAIHAAARPLTAGRGRRTREGATTWRH